MSETTMTMVERVARAIRAADMAHAGVDDWPAWEDAHGEWKDVYILRARAAIEEMREPTFDMVWSGLGPQSRHARNTWQAMIDAALNEKES